jgi:hypothetical protein
MQVAQGDCGVIFSGKVSGWSLISVTALTHESVVASVQAVASDVVANKIYEETRADGDGMFVPWVEEQRYRVTGTKSWHEPHAIANCDPIAINEKNVLVSFIRQSALEEAGLDDAPRSVRQTVSEKDVTTDECHNARRRAGRPRRQKSVARAQQKNEYRKAEKSTPTNHTGSIRRVWMRFFTLIRCCA